MRKRYSLLALQQIENLPSISVDESNKSVIQDKINFRRKQVNKLRLQGRTNNEIANALGYCLSVIEKDLHEINELSRKWFEEESVKEFCQSLQDSIIVYDNSIECLLILYTECDDIDSKLRILSKISEFQEKKYRLYTKTASVQDYLKRYCKNET